MQTRQDSDMKRLCHYSGILYTHYLCLRRILWHRLDKTLTRTRSDSLVASGRVHLFRNRCEEERLVELAYKEPHFEKLMNRHINHGSRTSHEDLEWDVTHCKVFTKACSLSYRERHAIRPGIWIEFSFVVDPSLRDELSTTSCSPKADLSFRCIFF